MSTAEITNLLTDADIERASTAIAAAQKKAGVTGATAAMQRLDLLGRVGRAPDGALVLKLDHLTAPEEPRPVSLLPGVYPWLDTAPQFHPLADGLKLYLGERSPVLAIARRRHILLDEQRQEELARLARLAAEAERQAAEQREGQRVRAWQALQPAERAVARCGEDFTASDFALALVAESRGKTQPPAGWAPVTVAPSAAAPHANAHPPAHDVEMDEEAPSISANGAA